MNIYTQDSPGDWQDWVKLPRNKNIPILEAKQKFLNEQLLHENQYQSFVQQQVAIQTQNAQTGGLMPHHHFKPLQVMSKQLLLHLLNQ